MSEINYQEGHEKVGQAKPVAWRYRYVKKGVTDFQGSSGLVTGNMSRQRGL